MTEDKYDVIKEEQFRKRMDKKYNALMNSPVIHKKNKERVEEFYMIEQHNLSYDRMYKYLSVIKEFFEIVGKRYDKLEKRDIARYLSELQLRHNNSQTIQKKLKDVKSFFRKCEDGDLPKFLRITYKLKSDLRKPKILDERDIRAIIQALTDNLRDQVFIVLSYEGALRANEVLRIKIEDITSIGGNKGKSFEVRAYNSKSDSPYKDKEKTILVKEYYFYLQIYLDKLKRDFGEDVHGYLFYNPDKGLEYPLSYAYVQRVMRKVRNKLNMKDLRHHDFRRSRVTHLMDKGFTEQQVKKYAGWSERSNMLSVYEERDYEDTKRKILEM